MKPGWLKYIRSSTSFPYVPGFRDWGGKYTGVATDPGGLLLIGSHVRGKERGTRRRLIYAKNMVRANWWLDSCLGEGWPEGPRIGILADNTN